VQTKRAAASDTSQATAAAAPPIVHEVLSAPGRPLDAETRTFMETRLGHDFGHLRVHTDARAAESAQALGAAAYAVGRDVVFAAGRYDPGSDAGRRLLAHELVHTMQQGGEATSVQRSCVKSPCPPVAVQLDALYPRYAAAENCIQKLYTETHPARPGVSLSFNADWVHLTGGSSQEKKALSCLRGVETPGAGPNYTAKGGMHAAAPDIWDFRNTTMYEITTAAGAPFRVGKLGAEIELANKLCSPAACGGLQFDRGTWSPGAGCVALGGDLYFTSFNNQGVITYSIIKDGTKELALLTALAMMAAALKSAGPKAGGAVAGKAVAGKAVPAYAIASLAAVAVLLASGKAEAKLGPGDEEPLVTLFKAMEQKGTPVPPEIQKVIDENPDLKAKLNKALGKDGDPTKLQEELNKQILDTIAANKDKFTPEELEVLLASAQVAGKSLPKGDMTVEELKKLAATAKSKGAGGGSGNAGGGSNDAPANVPTPPQPAAPVKDQGADATKDKPGGTGESAPVKVAQVSAATREKLEKSPAPVRELFNSLRIAGPNPKEMSDAHVQRFLSIVPAGLTADQLAKLRAKMAASTGQSVDEILDTLQTAVAQLGQPPPAEPGATGGDAGAKPAAPAAGDAAPAADATAKPPDTATLTTEGGGAAVTPEARDKLVKELAAKAKKESFKGLNKGQYRIGWLIKEEIKVGTHVNGSIVGITPDGKKYVGIVEVEIKELGGKDLKANQAMALFITATPMIGVDGSVVSPASHFITGQPVKVGIDLGGSKKPKNK
jgi:hypothetical protein